MDTNGWRPIETAPKDGTDILLAEIQKVDGKWHYGEIDVGCWMREPMSRDEYGRDYWFWASNYGRVEEPTHWQPLPEPPE